MFIMMFLIVSSLSLFRRAAKAAGMKCIITYTDSTASEDFYGKGADAKVPNLAGATPTHPCTVHNTPPLL